MTFLHYIKLYKKYIENYRKLNQLKLYSSFDRNGIACRYATNSEIINLQQEMELSRYYNFISYNINRLLVNQFVRTTKKIQDI